MDVLTLKEFQNTEIKYLNFANKDGKQWSIPMKNMRVALEVYEPSGVKGKLLKKLFPLVAKVGVAKSVLQGSYISVEMSEKLKEILVKYFGEKWEYSVFWGTPCVDQKITIQIYRDKEILGYCKVGNTERVKKLFEHEKRVLDLLKTKNMQHVSCCLAVEQVTDETWIFVQSTEKLLGAQNEHTFGEKHERFLENLWKMTKQSMPFEKTDYYQSLVFLEEHLDLLDEEYRENVKETLHYVKKTYQDKIVEWGMCHRDFTPWNTCVIYNELFVFDFEYALMHAPKEMDKWHFFVQTKCYEEKYSMEQIAQAYLEIPEKERDDIGFKCYILDIISLYLLRGTQTDLEIATQRSRILKKC